ncbi:MAG: DNA repair ATPase [Sandaracinaceae bacterium]|nr:DNA repair ATPase [Sandaracinaceae bacterium]
MSENAPTDGAAQKDALETGSYEVLRDRLVTQAKELSERAERLNVRRQEAFGGSELEIAGQAWVRTDNLCVPRDVVQVGGKLLFGFNVHVHMRDTTVSDVFSLHALEDTGDGLSLETAPLEGTLLADPEFRSHFEELYRYFQDARLLQLRITESSHLLAVFQIGATVRDVRVFHWQIAADGGVRYLGNRGERFHVFPPSHDFEWRTITRDDHVSGRFPHANVDGAVFVECTGGDLTIKVENNTESGEGVYREPVEQADQTLDDTEIHWAKVGGIYLLKIRPFREAYRYLVFDTRTHAVTRIDAIGQACLRLPEDQGIIFPGGYYLQSGDTKRFEGDYSDLELKRAIRSPNGEDVLYAFHRRVDGRYTLLPYNLIRKEVAQPIPCHGYSLFDDGKMVVFRYDGDEPVGRHEMQIYQTPFTSLAFAQATPPKDAGFLGKVGNAELVRAISEALTVQRLATPKTPSRAGYDDLISAATRTLDGFLWLSREDVGDLAAPLKSIRDTAELIIDEFEKVRVIRARAVEALAEAKKKQAELIRSLKPHEWREAARFMAALTGLRTLRGQLITLRELRYIDLTAIGALEAEAAKEYDRVSRATVEFLLDDAALEPLGKDLERLHAKIEASTKGTELKALGAEVDAVGEGLDVLSEVVAGLAVDDATARTAILERIGEVYGRLNRVRATLASKRTAVLTQEGRAEFAAQFALFSQSVMSALGQASTPEACDAQLSRLMVQLEELEARFGELDEFVGDLTEKREEVYEAFSGKKQQLLDERQRRAAGLVNAATRILEGVARRARTFDDADALNAWFASDAMVLKLRDLVERLTELGDNVHAEEISGKLKTARQDAQRLLRDKLDLFEDGESIIRLGRQRFGVNTQPLELTIVPRGDGMAYHLTGTDFHQAIEDAEFDATRDLWDQPLISEAKDVYRAEYLAACVLFRAERGEGRSIEALHAAMRDGKLLDVVREEAQSRYDEGYDRGVHDADAVAILEKLLAMEATAGLLRYPPSPRATACAFWAVGTEPAFRERMRRTGASLGRLARTFGRTDAIAAFTKQLEAAITPFEPTSADLTARYLADELMQPELRFTTSAEAVELKDALLRELEKRNARSALEEELRAETTPRDRVALAEAWLAAFLARGGDSLGGPDAARREALVPSIPEAATLLATDGALDRQTSAALSSVTVSGLIGQHARVEGGKLALRLDTFLERLGRFAGERVPRYKAYRALRHRRVEAERERLRIGELVPRVLSSFVRNRLIDEVYLPLIGDNLAKQIGAAGADARTDRMGLLLLISPPGYGKTTLMEYVASQLGLVFMKVNGPSLGHAVTSIDPVEAPNATARQEVDKINLGLEMGNNVMLYLDDIQHTSPELLQKFISLCDAQRRIEGVWNGKTRTYDLRGKRFCVVMAGNPYTESGEKFQIPDMLANRADTYNLGDILEGKGSQFELSYIENALTSNPVLAPVATRSLADVHRFLRMAQGEEVPSAELDHSYSGVEAQEITSVLTKLLRVQRVLSMVNAEYIRSASMEDAYRTEPPFKLQGSYRNMNKLAEKVVAAMNDDELDRLVDDHYQGESQTLTTGAEQNLLKLAEMRGRLTAEQAARWDEIKKEYRRLKSMGGGDDDPVVRLTGSLSHLGKQLDQIESAIRDAADRIVPAADYELT